MNKERIDAASREATDTANVTIGSEALSWVADVFGQSFGERTAVVVTDENAWAAGERVQRKLDAAGSEAVEPYAFPGKPTLYAAIGTSRSSRALASKGANKQRPTGPRL